MEETINKKDEENLEITRTDVSTRVLPKADIERNILNLEEDLVKMKALLDYFK